MRIRTERAQQWLFLAALFVCFLRMCGYVMEYAYVLPISMQARAHLLSILFVLAVCAMLLRGWTVLDVLLLLFAVMTSAIWDYNDFGTMVLFWVVARGLDKRWILQAWFGMHLVVIALCVTIYPILYAMGSPHANVTMNGTVSRYCFFFNHCNAFGYAVAFFTLAFVYLYYTKISFALMNLVLIAVSVFCWFAPKCKTATMILILCMCLLLLYRYLPRLFRLGMWIGVPAVLLLSFGLVACYYWGIFSQSEYILSADTFSARFIDAAAALKLYTLNLFGQEIYNIEQYIEVAQFARVTCFDMGYVHVFVRFGIVGGITFLGTVIWSMYHAVRRQDWLQSIMIFLMVVYFTMEWIPFTMMFPLLFANDLFDVKCKPLLRYSRYGLRAKPCGSERAVES